MEESNHPVPICHGQSPRFYRRKFLAQMRKRLEKEDNVRRKDAGHMDESLMKTGADGAERSETETPPYLTEEVPITRISIGFHKKAPTEERGRSKVVERLDPMDPFSIIRETDHIPLTRSGFRTPNNEERRHSLEEVSERTNLSVIEKELEECGSPEESIVEVRSVGTQTEALEEQRVVQFMSRDPDICVQLCLKDPPLAVSLFRNLRNM